MEARRGPWHASHKTQRTNNVGIYDADGSLLASIDVHQLAAPEVVAMRLAHGRLMAAAPDLLDALRAALNVLDATGAQHESNKARDAIEKATR